MFIKAFQTYEKISLSFEPDLYIPGISVKSFIYLNNEKALFILRFLQNLSMVVTLSDHCITLLINNKMDKYEHSVVIKFLRQDG